MLSTKTKNRTIEERKKVEQEIRKTVPLTVSLNYVNSVWYDDSEMLKGLAKASSLSMEDLTVILQKNNLTYGILTRDAYDDYDSKEILYINDDNYIYTLHAFEIYKNLKNDKLRRMFKRIVSHLSSCGWDSMIENSFFWDEEDKDWIEYLFENDEIIALQYKKFIQSIRHKNQATYFEKKIQEKPPDDVDHDKWYHLISMMEILVKFTPVYPYSIPYHPFDYSIYDNQQMINIFEEEVNNCIENVEDKFNDIFNSFYYTTAEEVADFNIENLIIFTDGVKHTLETFDKICEIGNRKLL